MPVQDLLGQLGGGLGVEARQRVHHRALPAGEPLLLSAGAEQDQGLAAAQPGQEPLELVAFRLMAGSAGSRPERR